MIFSSHTLTRLSLMGLTASLMACSTPGPEVAALKATSAAAMQLSDASTSALSSSWWQALGDAPLNALVTTALSDNPTLLAAQLRVQRMQALSGIAHANGLPQASLGADFTRQRFTANGLYPKPIAGNTWDNDTLQAGVSWSPDLWGQHAAELASAIGQTRAAQADAAVAATGLASQICKTYISLARLVEQRDIALRTQQQRQLMRQLTAERVAAGLDSQGEQSQSDGNLSDALVQVEALEEQISLTRHQLAVLSGQAPQALAALSPQLQNLQLGAPPTSLGADLLGRRPDVVASRWRVEAASQDVAVARTQFYPNVNLSAFVGYNALGLSHLLDAASRQIGVSPAVRLPLFDGGRLQAQLAGRQTERDMAVAQYNATVLEAVKETTDALQSAQSLRRQAQAQTAALISAQQNHGLAQQRMAAGLGNAVVVLSSETAVLAQRRAQADVRARQLDNQINLMKALGGGWQEEASQRSPQQVSQLTSQMSTAPK
jgi:NodT family efflux transporter outer membrane factor (OMF) lipoprotein